MLLMVLVGRYTNKLIGKFFKLNYQRGVYPIIEGIKKKSQSTLESKAFQFGVFKASVFSSTTSGLSFSGRSM